jgi:threonine dehydrogenase-like Zn-dependent dehydrogenase
MMQAAFYTSGGFVVRDVPEPIARAGEVVVRVHACGICGSDLHFARGLEPPPAVCPGHEICGWVAAAAPGIAAGQAVVVEPLVACGGCQACTRGEPNLCAALEILGRHRPGGFAEAVAVPVGSVYPVPAGLPLDAAVLTEPLAVAVHAVDRVGVAPGTAVLVLGGGTIGLLTAFVAVRAGAEVTIAVRHPHQRRAALDLGAAAAVHAVTDDALRDAVAGRRPDVVFETVGGRASTFALALACVRPGGSIGLVGVFTGPLTVDAEALLAKEARVVPSMMYRRTLATPDFARALAMLRDEHPRLAPLVTHRIPLRVIGHAFALAGAKRAGAIKVAVQPDQKL